MTSLIGSRSSFPGTWLFCRRRRATSPACVHIFSLHVSCCRIIVAWTCRVLLYTTSTSRFSRAPSGTPRLHLLPTVHRAHVHLTKYCSTLNSPARLDLHISTYFSSQLHLQCTCSSFNFPPYQSPFHLPHCTVHCNPSGTPQHRRATFVSALASLHPERVHLCSLSVVISWLRSHIIFTLPRDTYGRLSVHGRASRQI